LLDNVEELFPRKGEFEDKARLWRELKSHAKRLLFVATSCNPDGIDSMIRDAFFDTEVKVSLPTPFERYMILRTCVHQTLLQMDSTTRMEYVDRNGTAIPIQPPISAGPLSTTLQRIATESHAFMAADLKALWQMLCRDYCTAVDDSSRLLVREEYFQQALDAMKKNATLLRTAVSGKSAFLTRFDDKTNTSMDQIGGLKSVKAALRQSIAGAIATTPKMMAISRRALRPFRTASGVLLYGPPGTGKTLLAKALAGQYNINFVPISIPDLIKAEVGESEKMLHEYFLLARQCRPCVVFLDEVDAIFGGERGSGGGGSDTVIKRLISQLLLELDALDRLKSEDDGNDGVKQNLDHILSGWTENERPAITGSGVLVLAATNIPTALDSALLRPGRFEKCIYVPPPDASARRQILETLLAKMTCHVDVDATFIDHLVTLTEFFSGADLANMCRHASMTTMQRTRDEIISAQGGDGDDFKNMWLEKMAVAQSDFFDALQSVRPSITSTLLVRYEQL
jgi:SpoVK/Ycf46/Vps4 family AAA+-type ATPase